MDSSQDILIECRHLHKSFGPTHALNDVSFCLRRGEVAGLIGENGSILTESKLFENQLVATELDLFKLAQERRRLTTYRQGSMARAVSEGSSVSSSKSCPCQFSNRRSMTLVIAW